MRIFLFFLFSVSVRCQCPAKQATPKCECSVLEGGPEKLRVLCTGVKPADFSSMFGNLGALDVTLQNGGFSSLSTSSSSSGQFFVGINVGKLTLISNGIEKLSLGDFKGSSSSFRELSVSEPGLRLVEDLALNDIPSIQRLSVSDSAVLERFPKLKGLPNLTSVSFTNNSVRFLESGEYLTKF
jgi:Leucine-rich repeat (LRR) protein